MKYFLSVLVAIGGIGGIMAISYISAYNFGNRMETLLAATMDNNRNILAQYGNSVTEAAQVTEMQRDDLTAVVTAALEGRYGDDGSRAVFQFIQEQNPQIDSSVYVQLQRIIEAGRIEFQNSQTVLLDQKRVYETGLGSFWQGTWLAVAGYPKTDLSKIDIVSTTRANEAFDTKLEEAIQLRD